MLDRLLDRPVSVTMTLLVFVVLGVVGIFRLPVSLVPEMDMPRITVQVAAGEMSAEEIDKSVTSPLRSALVQMEHLKDIRTESRDGSASIVLDFEAGEDVDYLYIEANEKVDRALASLPRIDRPKVLKTGASDIPAFYLNITGKEAGTDFLGLSDFAGDVIVRRIEQLPQVAMVDVSGTVDREILVVPDEPKLAALGVSMREFTDAISAANVKLSNLTIRNGVYHYSVKFRSFASSADDIADVYFRSGDRTLQVKDVARVVERERPRTGLALSEGKDAVVLAVIKQSDAKMSELRRGITELTASFERDYPQVAFEVTRDQTELLEYSIHSLITNIIVALLLVCVVVFLFMKDLRSPLLVCLTLPASLLVSFFVFYLCGLSINVISISGLLIGVGMMVDNTIILTDNITSRWMSGEDLRSAVVKGTGEVAGAMLSSVLTTCAVFIPLVFLDGLAGELFHDQAISLTIVLLCAYVVTVLVIPVYYWALYRKLPSFKPDRFLSRLTFPRLSGFYDRGVNFFLRHKKVLCATIFPSCILLAALSMVLMPKQRLPDITYTDAVLDVDWNEPLSVEENRRRVLLLGDGLLSDCEQHSALVGSQQFVLAHGDDISSDEASIYFKMASAAALEAKKQELASYLRRHYPRAIVKFSASGNIFDMVFADTEAPLVARLRPKDNAGVDVARLQGFLAELSASLPDCDISSVPLKSDVLYIADPEKMSLYGISFDELSSVLRGAIGGDGLYEIIKGNRSVPVLVGSGEDEMERALAAATVRKGDVVVPLSAVMSRSFGQSLKSVVSGPEGNYYPLEIAVRDKDVPAVMSMISRAASDNGNFDVAFSGSYFTNRGMMKNMALVLTVAVLLLFLILASQFESLVQPLIILSEIVVDIALSLVVLLLLGESINIMSLIGLVVITGIVINDSILKVDTINRLLRSGLEVDAAIHEAGHRRAKAIIMTSITTVFSVIPFLSRGNMGDDLQFPMAVVIVVGMSIGTLVSLFLLPALYSLVYKRR